jgi:hypothetical protein
MNAPTELPEEGLPLPNTTSSAPAPASGHTEPNTNIVSEKPLVNWSSASTFCDASSNFLGPVSLLFGEGGGDDDEMPGATLLAADESETSTSLNMTEDDISLVTETVEEALSPGYQKRGRFIIWPTTLGGPMGFPLSLRANKA